jgi:cytoskeletal protein CcmA (bactofilin family)
MFEKKQKSDYHLLGKTNRIVDQTKIVGNIVSPADMRLDGELIGDITCVGKVVLGAKSKVQGTIICKNIDIEGVFTGKLEVENLLGIKKTAIIKGEVYAGKLSIEPGAVFEASCEMRYNK